jgi:hypothetical protein
MIIIGLTGLALSVAFAIFVAVLVLMEPDPPAKVQRIRSVDTTDTEPRYTLSE